MPKDPICGMNVSKTGSLKLDYKGESHYFCSMKCVNKFAEEHDIAKEQLSSAVSKGEKKFYKNKTFIVAAIIIVLITLSYIFPFFVSFRESIYMYFSMIWWAILLGIFLGGLIDRFVPTKYVSNLLTERKKRTILYSVILGFFMSFCSHGILALSIQLYKKGASNFSVITFLLASPWANLAVTFMLFGFFGLKALYILLSAILVAIITGFIYMLLESKEIIPKNENSLKADPNFSIKKDIKSRFHEYEFTTENAKKDLKGIWAGMVSLSNMVLWWILLGMALAGFANAYVPSEFFHNFMGPNFIGMAVTLLFATIIEVCSEGSSPLAFEIYNQTQAFGNSFVFLMAGVATDYTEIGLLWTNIGRKVAITLPLVTVPQILALGYIMNLTF